MIVAFDTYYYDNFAKTVGISFENWSDEDPIELKSEIKGDISHYEPGLFYKRELPCILSLLEKFVISDIEFIIVDGYSILDNEGKLGLGGHLYEAMERRIPVIGVAKNKYNTNTENVRKVFRGKSIKPLYISAVGIDLDKAYRSIKAMHGDYRIPSLLKIVDLKSKEKSG